MSRRYPIPPKTPPACRHSDCLYEVCHYAEAAASRRRQEALNATDPFGDSHDQRLQALRVGAAEQRIRDAVRTVVGTHTYEDVVEGTGGGRQTVVEDTDALIDDLVALVMSERSRT